MFLFFYSENTTDTKFIARGCISGLQKTYTKPYLKHDNKMKLFKKQNIFIRRSQNSTDDKNILLYLQIQECKQYMYEIVVVFAFL